MFKFLIIDVKVRIVFSILLFNICEFNGSKFRMNFSFYVFEVIIVFIIKYIEIVLYESVF